MIQTTLIFIIFVATVLGDNEPNRLRVCSSSEESVEINDASCNRGYWMSEAINPDCVCATGTWLLSTDYCDANFFLISGPSIGDTSGSEFTCFKLPSPFRRIVSLGSQSKTNRQFLIQSNGKSIQEVTKASFSPDSQQPVVIIRTNAKTEMYLVHKDGVQSSIWQKCLGSKRLKRPYTHIIKSDNSVAYLKSVDEDELCDDVRDTDFPYERSNNSDWLIDSPGSYGWSVKDGSFPLNPCNCPPPHLTEVLEPKMLNDTSKSQFTISMPEDEIEPDPMRNTDPDYDLLPSDSFNIYPKKRDPLVYAEHLTDNARTTAAILTKLKDFVLTGVRPPPFRNPLFEYVRYGKRIIGKYCPEIRPAVIGNLVGMYRLLLGYIINKYPEEYSLNVDTVIHERVLSSLDKCFKAMGSGNRTVKFSWGKGKKKADGTCEKRKIESIEVDGKSIPVQTDSENGGMPPELRFINGDVMLEVAWKILMGTHYACAEYFVDNPEDLSFMYVKTQEFLTIPYIMFRWENPAKGLTAAYRLLNPMLNPDVLGEQIDTCVWAAFDSSRFNTWLGRPASESEFIPKSVMEKSMNKLTGRSDSLRKKEGGIGNSNGMTQKILSKTGYCVHDFNDPLSWNEIENSETSITGC